MKRAALIFLTDVSNKDGDVANHCWDYVIDKLESLFRIKFQVFVDIGDTAPTEYRVTRCVEGHVQKRAERRGLSCYKEFFAEYHGTGPGDQTIAVIKKKLKRGVIGDHLIRTKEEVSAYLTESLLLDTSGDDSLKLDYRYVHCIDEADVKRSRKPPTLTGIKKCYSVRSSPSPSSRYTPTLYNLSCSCKYCFLERDASRCTNRKVVKRAGQKDYSTWISDEY